MLELIMLLIHYCSVLSQSECVCMLAWCCGRVKCSTDAWCEDRMIS